MQTMHSTLLIGRYDWESAKLPKEEFDQRLASLWKALPADVAAIAVYGDRRANAEIAYLTNFVPKLRDGLAVIPREGEAKLYVTGSPKMMATAGRQTWIKQLQPLSEPGKALAEWKAKGAIAFLGGENLRLALRKAVDEATAAEASKTASATVQSAMRAKRDKELAAVREGCGILAVMAKALAAAHQAGKGATVALMEAEHAAHAIGAMEVRTLLSLDGGRTLRPYMVPVEKAMDPYLAYFAVRASGYWSEGFVTLSKAANPAKDKAAAALNAMIAAAKPGASVSDLAAKAPSPAHPVTATALGGGIGLAMEEEPRIASGGTAKLAAGQVLSLRAGVSEGTSHAIVSAMVAITASGHEVLWSSI